MTIKLLVRLVGVFKGISGREQLRLEFDNPVSVDEVIRRLLELTTPEIERVLVDPELDDPRPNAVILVNGKEIGVLKGLQTKVSDGDEIVLIPVSHGG
jgi:molybdopterin converting factor small subunit